MKEKILTMEEFGLLPTQEKRKYLINAEELIDLPECPFWVERMINAIRSHNHASLSFLDVRLAKWYWELVGD